jgi:hypothetical protein
MAALTVVVRLAHAPERNDALGAHDEPVRVLLPAAPGDECVAAVFAAVAPRGLPRGEMTVSVPNVRLLAPEDAVGRHAFGNCAVLKNNGADDGGSLPRAVSPPLAAASFSLSVVAVRRAGRCDAQRAASLRLRPPPSVILRQRATRANNATVPLSRTSFAFYLQRESNEPAELRLSSAGEVSADQKAAVSNALRAVASFQNPPAINVVMHVREPYRVSITHVDGVLARCNVTLPGDATLQALRDAAAAYAVGGDVDVFAASLWCAQARLRLTPDADGGATLQSLRIPDGTIDVEIRPPCRSDLLYIKLPYHGGRTIVFYTRLAEATVMDVKEFIAAKEGDPPAAQRLVFGGKQLEDGRTLAEYDISAEQTVYLLFRLCGGMFHETSGRVDNALVGALHDAVPQLRVCIHAPGGQQYTVEIDPLAPVAALAPLLTRAIKKARRAAPDGGAGGGGGTDAEALRAELARTQTKYDVALAKQQQHGDKSE